MSMTEEQYAAYLKTPSECPLCGGEITGGPVEVDHPHARQAISCNECDAEWMDVYHLRDAKRQQPPRSDRSADAGSQAVNLALHMIYHQLNRVIELLEEGDS